MMCLLLFRTLLFVLTAKSAFHQISIRWKWRFVAVFEYNPILVRNQYIKVIFGITSLPFPLNSKIRKHTEIHNFDTEFIQKAIASF